MEATKELQWQSLIGAFIINFGALEITTYHWITALSTGTDVRDRAIDHMLLGKRIALVRELVTASNLPKERKLRALELWNEVTHLSIIRNKLVHSPLCWNPNGSDDLGFVDVKKMKGIGPYTIEPLNYVEIARAGSKLAKILEELLGQFGADLVDATVSKAS